MPTLSILNGESEALVSPAPWSRYAKMRLATSLQRTLTWHESVLYAPDRAVAFLLTPGFDGEDDVVEVVDAPKEVWVSNELLANADPRFLAQGDGILTFCPNHPSRVSYRVAGERLEQNMTVLERIS